MWRSMSGGSIMVREGSCETTRYMGEDMVYRHDEPHAMLIDHYGVVVGMMGDPHCDPHCDLSHPHHHQCQTYPHHGDEEIPRQSLTRDQTRAQQISWTWFDQGYP